MNGHRNLKTQILEQRRNGKSYREIEKMLNCGRSTIHYHCEKHNVTDTGKKRYALTNDAKLEIADYCKHNKLKDAQIHFNLSKSTIFKYRNFELKTNEKK